MEEVKDLKTTAKEAKIRFKRGFWKEYNKNKELKIEEAKEKGLSTVEAVKIEAEKARRNIKIQFEQKTEDDLFYEKVVELLKSEEIILNPIKRLVNDEEYQNLGENEKQLYILNLTEKFNEMKERFNKEKVLG